MFYVNIAVFFKAFIIIIIIIITLFQEDNILGTNDSLTYDLSRLKTNRCYHTESENGNRVFTHSMLIKMYYTSSWYVQIYVHCI